MAILPSVVILRIREFWVSETYTVPATSTAMMLAPSPSRAQASDVPDVPDGASAGLVAGAGNGQELWRKSLMK